MIEVLRAAVEVQDFCQEHQWRFCFIGGVALLRWGEPRETVDVDLTLLTGLGDESAYIEKLIERFEPRLSDASEFAMQKRVLLLRNRSGVGIDIALGWIPFEEGVVARATVYEYAYGISLLTCSAEDLVVMKAFAGRGQDWVDVQNVVIRQSGTLDWPYIGKHLKVLADASEKPEILAELERIRRESEAQ